MRQLPPGLVEDMPWNCALEWMLLRSSESYKNRGGGGDGNVDVLIAVELICRFEERRGL